jgi:hypothetical protein
LRQLRVFYRLKKDGRQIAWTSIRREPPWPEGEQILEAQDQTERILLSRPEKVLRDPGTGVIARKPRVRVVPSALALQPDGQDEVHFQLHGVPADQRIGCVVDGQRLQRRAGDGFQVRSQAAKTIVVEFDDPYVDISRRRFVIDAHGGPSA